MRSTARVIFFQLRGFIANSSGLVQFSVTLAEAVRYEARDGIGVITLDRPDQRNSMTPELLDAFARASASARADADIRALVVSGTGTCFSAGADFNAGLQRGGGDLAPHERMATTRAVADNAPFAVRATKASIRRGLGAAWR